MTSSDDGAIYEQMDPDIVPGEMTLEEFVKNFGHTLPQQVCLHCGEEIEIVVCYYESIIY